MVCSGRALLLGALLVLVAGLATEAASKDKSPPCVYSEQPQGSAEEPAKRSRLVLRATTPAEGEAVHPGTVIGIDVEYHVANFAPGRYRLVINFSDFIPGSTTTVDDTDGSRFITQAHGAAHLCATIRGLFPKEDVRWPLQMYVSLQESTGGRSSTLHAETRRVSFPSPDLSARALERQKLAPPEDYFHALDAIFTYREEHSAVYRACVARLPDTAATLAEPLPPGCLPSLAQGGNADIVAAARSQIGVTIHYDPAYRSLAYPGGDVPADRGVCTDVIVRALRVARAIDLQRQVHEDIKAHWDAYSPSAPLGSAAARSEHRPPSRAQSHDLLSSVPAMPRR